MQTSLFPSLVLGSGPTGFAESISRCPMDVQLHCGFIDRVWTRSGRLFLSRGRQNRELIWIGIWFARFGICIVGIAGILLDDPFQS